MKVSNRYFVGLASLVIVVGLMSLSLIVVNKLGDSLAVDSNIVEKGKQTP